MTEVAVKLVERMFGAANGGTDFLRMAYPQQSAHMGSRLQLVDAQGHTQTFSEELLIGRAAMFVSVCQDRYGAMVKNRASRDGSPTTDLRELRSALRRSIRLYAHTVTAMLDEKDRDSPLAVHRALYPIVAAQPHVRRAFVGTSEDGGDATAPIVPEVQNVEPLDEGGETPPPPDAAVATVES